jgi:hypothetical protein
MLDFGLEFENDICCVDESERVVNGNVVRLKGDFVDALAGLREEAVFNEDRADGAQSWQAMRDPNDNFRFKWYCQFIGKMGLGGRGRVEIPLCYVNAIREIWPSKSGTYKGHQFKT